MEATQPVPDFLLELRCEEIPARMQAGARAELEKLFRNELGDSGVDVSDVNVWSTPRRLALIARNMPESTSDFHEEIKGPRTSAPPQALEGFLRKVGLTKDFLEERDGVWYATISYRGRATRDVLSEAIPAIVRAFPWPKSMRWGDASLSTESLRWVRPLSGVVAIFGEDLVECEIGGISSSYATLGHRFHHDGPITIGGADDYQEKLRACHVIVDHAERQNLIREGAKAAAEAVGLTLVEDEGLVIENAGLTEWPVPLLGRFDAAFLDVPPEVIQLTARVNQKYFVCKYPPRDGEGDRSQGGGGDLGTGAASGSESPPSSAAPPPPPRVGEALRLANAFVCTANIDAADGGAVIVDGNRKVLAARLSDARFFWEQDRKTSLAEHARQLERITFHEKLGTVADKVERVAKLARWLVEEGIVGGGVSPREGGDLSKGGAPYVEVPAFAGTREELADLAEQAARLAKADLVTEMVGEFPELQGVMGGYYARAEGLPDSVADAIRDHYKPVGQGDEVPTAPVTVAVSLADKLDTLFAFFTIGEMPSGSRDPFALRRAALGSLSLIVRNQLRFSLITSMIFGIPNVGKSMARAHSRREISAREAIAGTTLVSAESKAQLLNPFGVDVDLDWQENPVLREIADKVGKAPQLLADFMTDRLKVQQREAGVRHDLVDAVFALGGEDDLVRLLARVHALQAFMGSDDGANLLAGYKRAANILKKEGWDGASGSGQPLRNKGIPRTGEEDPLAMVDDPDMAAVMQARLALDRENSLSYTPEHDERTLIDALDLAEPLAATTVEAEDFAAAMAALASLRAPIDAFFDSVTVNDADPAKREARLGLLARFRDAVHRVADFSRIEG